jgi:hypothetical protein
MNLNQRYSINNEGANKNMNPNNLTNTSNLNSLSKEPKKNP